MTFKQTAVPTVEPLTSSECLDHLLVIETDERAAQASYIDALVVKARRFVERSLERQLTTATWRLTLEEFPDEIELRPVPAIAVSSITYVDTAGTTQTLAATEYQTDLGAEDKPARIKPAYGKSWPSTRGDTYAAVTVTFTAGYGATAASVPQTIRHAMLLLVAHWYNLREPINVGNIVNEIPFSVASLLNLEDWGAYS